MTPRNDWLDDELVPRASRINDVWFDLCFGQIFTNEDGTQEELQFFPPRRSRITSTGKQRHFQAIREELHELLDKALDRYETAFSCA